MSTCCADTCRLSLYIFFIIFLITVGARVYARWTNGLYYRGFVSRSASSTVSIRYDDGDKTTLPKNDESAVILDKIPQDFKLEIGQNVIGYGQIV